jgi:hypothetical protein
MTLLFDTSHLDTLLLQLIFAMVPSLPKANSKASVSRRPCVAKQVGQAKK